MEMNDSRALHGLVVWFSDGLYGLSQDMNKALELWHRAGMLGHPSAYYNIGVTYDNGSGVEVDKEKAKHYWQLAAMMGHVSARYNLGAMEENLGNMDRALKHYMISAMGGQSISLEAIKELFMDGLATKNDYGTALRAYQTYLVEIRSDQRDKAAAYDNQYKYY